MSAPYLRSAPPPPPAPADDPPYDAPNFWRFVGDSGLYGAALAFVLPTTILPLAVRELGGPDWVIAFLPNLMLIGFSLPQLFTAHWVEGLSRLKKVVAFTGIFQRLPYLLAGLVALFFGQTHPTLTVAFIALAPLLSGFAGGLTVLAWLELNIRVIPRRKRAALAAWRLIIKDVGGFGIGFLVVWILAHQKGATGFGLVHLLAFVLFMLSWTAFVSVREPPPVDKPRQSLGLWANLRLIPSILRASPALRTLIPLRLCLSSMSLTTPFLALAAQADTGLGDSFVAALGIYQVAGGLAANIFCIRLGDRLGGERLYVMAVVSLVTALALSHFLPTVLGHNAAFFLLGLGLNLDMTGQSTTNMNSLPAFRRPTALGILATIQLLFLIALSQGAYLLHRADPHLEASKLVATLALLLALPLLRRLARLSP